ncbi:hypothetical protein [Falsiroseomonas sp.]|uniref:hypothetical protein n=1 Tax=Falsiroseomonas sp. TaxID=2870721 RepID=UPI0035690D77
MQSNSNRSDSDQEPTTTETGDTTPAAPTRADIYRERFRQAQTIAAQIARARAAGGLPSEDEAARLVAEFHARGGQVTVCPQPEEAAPDDQDRRKPGKRPAAG